MSISLRELELLRIAVFLEHLLHPELSSEESGDRVAAMLPFYIDEDDLAKACEEVIGL